MPIYEYACQNCGHEFESLVRNDEKPRCPSCGRRRLSKKFSVPAAHTAASGPSCPARETGGCNVGDCGAAGCNLHGLA